MQIRRAKTDTATDRDRLIAAIERFMVASRGIVCLSPEDSSQLSAARDALHHHMLVVKYHALGLPGPSDDANHSHEVTQGG